MTGENMAESTQPYTTVKCGLCKTEGVTGPNGDEVWILVGNVTHHLETVHGERIKSAARWPDGDLVIVNEDEMNQGLGSET